MVLEIANTVNYVQQVRAQNPQRFSRPLQIFTSRIVGTPTPISGKTATVGGASAPVAWKYDWEEVSFNAANTYEITLGYRRTRTLAGSSGWAYNGCEGPQSIATSSYATLGPGITTANIPAGMNFQPICENTIVLMYALERNNGEPFFFFSCPNAIDGTCA